MNKTIFEGVINGEKFNNVQEYNKRLTSLLNAGQKVNAHASTNTVDEEVSNECGCEQCTCNSCEHCKSDYSYLNDLLFPGFSDNDTFIEDLLNNLDSGVQKSELEGILNAITGIIDEFNHGKQKEIHKILDNMTEDGLDDYLEQISDILEDLNTAYINSVRENTTDIAPAMEIAKTKIKNAVNRQNKLKEQFAQDMNKLDNFISKCKAEFSEFDNKKKNNDLVQKIIKLVNIFYNDMNDYVSSKLEQPTTEDSTVTSFTNIQPQQECDFAVGNSDLGVKDVTEMVKDLARMVNDLTNMKGDKTVPAENAKRLLKEIFGK